MSPHHTMGASDAAVALGLQRRAEDGTPYTSALELWARLTGLIERYDDSDSPAAELGRLLEPRILLLYAEREQIAVYPGPPFGSPGWVTPVYPWLHVRPDGYDLGRTRVVEAKAPRCLDPDRWGPTGSDEVPSEHAVQVLVQVAVAYQLHRTEIGDLVALARDPGGWNDRRTYAVYTLRRDAQREEQLMSALSAWYDDHVIGRVPPPPDGSESARRTLGRMFRPTDVAAIASPSAVEWHHKLLALRSVQEEISGRREELEQRLKAELGAATELTTASGRVLVTWRPDKNGTRIFRVKGRT